jgi:hypothetical protein
MPKKIKHKGLGSGVNGDQGQRGYSARLEVLFASIRPSYRTAYQSEEAEPLKDGDVYTSAQKKLSLKELIFRIPPRSQNSVRTAA